MYEQIDFAQTLPEKILAYLGTQTGYRSPKDIAHNIGADVVPVRDECSRLYWVQSSKLSRTVSDPLLLDPKVYYRLSS